MLLSNDYVCERDRREKKEKETSFFLFSFLKPDPVQTPIGPAGRGGRMAGRSLSPSSIRLWKLGKGAQFPENPDLQRGPNYSGLEFPISVITNSIPIWNFNSPESDLPALFFRNIKAERIARKCDEKF
jgi:hypothetical protein